MLVSTASSWLSCLQMRLRLGSTTRRTPILQFAPDVSNTSEKCRKGCYFGIENYGISQDRGRRYFASMRPPRINSLPPLRPQLPGATASAFELFWFRNRLKVYGGVGSATALTLMWATGTTWLALASVSVVGGILGYVWYRNRSADKKLLRLFPILEELALGKRKLISSYIGEYEFAPLNQVFAKEHTEETPVGKRPIAVFVFEVRGKQGSGLAQAKWVKSKVKKGASSTLQAANSAPKTGAAEFARKVEEVGAHKDELMKVPLPRFLSPDDAPEWTLVDFFLDVVDFRNIRDSHIIIVDKDEHFEYYDVESRTISRERITDTPFEKRRQQSQAHDF